jgi:hypothetical protein
MRQVIAHGLAVLVLVSLSPGCALRHPVTPTLSAEGQLAVYGRQVIAAASSAADGVDQLIAAGEVSKEQGVAVLKVIRYVGVEGERLGHVLTLIDAARTEVERSSGLQQAAGIIQAIQQAVTDAVVPVGTESGRQKVAAVMRIVATALMTLAVQLPPDPAPVKPSAAIISGPVVACA